MMDLTKCKGKLFHRKNPWDNEISRHDLDAIARVPLDDARQNICVMKHQFNI